MNQRRASPTAYLYVTRSQVPSSSELVQVEEEDDDRVEITEQR